MSAPAYPSYKPSEIPWIGALPSHWETVPYKRMVDIQNGADHKEIEQEHGYPVIGSGGIFAYASEYMYDGDSVLLGRKGTVDRPLFVSGRFWTVDTMYWTKIAPDACARFAYYTALTIPFNYYSTNTALPSMTKSVLHSHFVALPPTSEQFAIAAFLDRETAKIDALVEEQRRLIELLKEKRQAVISQAVTKGLDPNAPMKDSGVEWLGKVPEHWKSQRLKTLFRQEKRQGFEEMQVLSVYRDFGVILKDSRTDNFNKTPDDLSSYQLVQTGDLVVNKMKAWQGSLGISPLDGITSPDYVVFSPLHAEHPDYLHLLLRSKGMVSTYLSISNGIRLAQWRLEPEAFLAQQVFLPPIGEQKAIARYLEEQMDRWDSLVSEAEQGIELLQQRRSALISAAVTGKIDVRGLAPQAEGEAA